MFGRVPAETYDTVSAIWNGAYDLGMGIGAVGVGALVTMTGFETAYVVVACAMLPALVMAHREARPDPSRDPEVALVRTGSAA